MLLHLVLIFHETGAGKSTLMKNLMENTSKYNFVDEPLALWSTLKNDDGKSLLETYYSGNLQSTFYFLSKLVFQDRFRWSFTFQMCALLSRFSNIESSIISKSNNNQKNIFITERCLQTDYECFAKMLHSDGAINKLEFEIYKQYFDHLNSRSIKLNGIIFLKTDPEQCKERIQKRNRPGEESITLEYLKKLDEITQTWIHNSKVPVLQVDSTVTTVEIETFISKIV
jgi:deoxycitidine kinase